MHLMIGVVALGELFMHLIMFLMAPFPEHLRLPVTVADTSRCGLIPWHPQRMVGVLESGPQGQTPVSLLPQSF